MEIRDLMQYSEEDHIELLKEFGRTPETVKQDIEIVRTFLQKQPHLPEVPGKRHNQVHVYMKI